MGDPTTVPKVRLKYGPPGIGGTLRKSSSTDPKVVVPRTLITSVRYSDTTPVKPEVAAPSVRLLLKLTIALPSVKFIVPFIVTSPLKDEALGPAPKFKIAPTSTV